MSKEPHPEEKASLLSRTTFAWLGKIVYQGYAKAYEEEDLLELRSCDQSHTVYNQLQGAWTKEKQRIQSPSLARAIRIAFGWNMFCAGVCKFMGDLCGYVSPICLNLLIRYIEEPSSAWFYPDYFGYILIAFIFVGASGQTLFLHQHHHIVIREGIRARGALINIIYRKSLILDPIVKQEIGTGRIVNHQSADVGRILDLFYFSKWYYDNPVAYYLYLISFLFGSIYISSLHLGCSFTSYRLSTFVTQLFGLLFFGWIHIDVTLFTPWWVHCKDSWKIQQKCPRIYR